MPDESFNRAFKLHQAGKLQEAETLYRQILAQTPDHLFALNLLGVLVSQLGRPDEGEGLIRRSLALDRASSVLNNLANVLGQQPKRRAEAVDLYREALQLDPSNAQFHANLGMLLHRMGDHEQAIASLRTSLALDPRQWLAQTILWTALGESGRPEQIEAEYLRFAKQLTDLAEVHINASAVLQAFGKLETAFAASQRAVQMRGGLADAHSSLANALVAQGRTEEAIAEYRQAVRINPRQHQAHSNLLFALHYICEDPAELSREHRAWGELHAPARPGPSIRRGESDPSRRLRVGYVSPDLRDHAVGRLLLPILANRDRTSFEVSCYSTLDRPDKVTRVLQSSCDAWHDVADMPDDALAELIRSHRIDILVDLAGHTAHGRLMVFARRPARVQVSYLGYPDTTGIGAMDYRITDAVADPPGTADPFNVEQLLRLAGCFICLPMGDDLPAPSDMRRESAWFTFGCFNNIAKISPQTIRLWASILQQASDARLLLRTKGLDDPPTADRFRERLSSHGVPVDRVDLLGFEDGTSHLMRYNQVDLALDTFPYSGTATTCDALSMGVPVVTLPGQTHASRVGASLLSAAGLAMWISQTAADYVRLAVEAASAGEPRTLAQRIQLRGQVANSSLCDQQSFARRIESAYRQIATGDDA